MEKLQRFTKLSLIPMTILLPVWLIVGRALLGSIGWFTLILLFTVVPVMLVVMIAITILLFIRSDVRETKRASVWDARLIVAYYVCTFLFGIFLVDFGDTDDSAVSVASHALGRGFIPASSVLALIFGALAVGLLAASLVLAIVELVRSKKQAAPTTRPAA